MVSRQFTDEDGANWEAFASDAIVAHGKPGAALSFRGPGAAEAAVFNSTVTFNSARAAHAAIGSMSVRELRRRLDLARMAVGGV